VFCCIWHSIIGSSILPGEIDDKMSYDQWALISFGALFCLLHVIAGFWLFSAYKKVKKIKKGEKEHLYNLNTSKI
jgi:hypothetical protein